MKPKTTPYPAFGAASGYSATFGMTLIALIFGVLNWVGSSALPLNWVVVGFSAGKILCEVIYWNGWRLVRRLPGRFSLGGLTAERKQALRVCWAVVVADHAIEVLLMWQASRVGVDPVSSGLCLAGCLAVSGPVHGYLVESGRVKMMTKGFVVSSVAVLLVGFLSWEWVIFVLCGKGILSQPTVAARARMSDELFEARGSDPKVEYSRPRSPWGHSSTLNR